MTGIADQGFRAGAGFVAIGPDRDENDQPDDQQAGHADAPDHAHIKAKARHTFHVKHKHRSYNKSGNAAEAQYAEGRHEGFRYHKDQAQQHQGKPGGIDRQHVHRVKPENQ